MAGNEIWRPDVKNVNVLVMHRHCVATVLLAALVSGSLSISLAAQDAAKGAALLADARQAIGGEERLRASRRSTSEGDFKRVAGQTTIEGELQVRIERPDKLRRDEDLSPPGGGPAIIRTEVLNGTTVWDENSGGGGFFVAAWPGRRRGSRRALVDAPEYRSCAARGGPAARTADRARAISAWMASGRRWPGDVGCHRRGARRKGGRAGNHARCGSRSACLSRPDVTHAADDHVAGDGSADGARRTPGRARRSGR